MADDLVSINISQTLARLSPISPEGCISKVPNYLRKVDEKAYEPHQLAIGPYHRGKVHLQAMEEHKFRYLQILLRERKEINDVSKYVKAMKKLETRARNFYTDPINLESDDFVKMMLLDACFIVQVIRMRSISDRSILKVENDPIFLVTGLRFTIRRDLLLHENQIPFFVVLELIEMIGISDKANFTRKIFGFLKNTLPDSRYRKDGLKSINEIKHLLDLIHDYWHPTPLEIGAYGNRLETGVSFKRCATELKEAGIKFRKGEGKSLFDIKYENGILKIPNLTIDDNTDYLLRNLIAFEQLFPCGDIRHVTDYTVFMDCLINSAKDVEVLHQFGIIENNLGDDEAVATMFNRLTDSVVFDKKGYYPKLFSKVNHYCSRRRNKWLAKLNHNYFHSPWALISVLPAAVILLLTLLQTIFSGIAL
ncbi:hypothetical protein REPUB_Repub20aG0065800 [Reevesia pubescens]